MSKQKRGMFRRMIDTAKRAMGMPVTHHYDDPVIRAPAPRVRSHGKPRMVRKPLPCEPGTITYHDKLVKHFGRRRAEVYRRLIQDREMDKLPTEQDFIDNPPWLHLQ